MSLVGQEELTDTTPSIVREGPTIVDSSKKYLRRVTPTPLPGDDEGGNSENGNSYP